MSTTTDLSDFGFREIKMAAALLTAWTRDGLPEDFRGDGVQLMMNRNSGNVFLTNEDAEVAMMNGDDLESFYSSPHEGVEGFFDELKDQYAEMHPDDRRWLRDIAEVRGEPLEEEAEETEEEAEEIEA